MLMWGRRDGPGGAAPLRLGLDAGQNRRRIRVEVFEDGFITCARQLYSGFRGRLASLTLRVLFCDGPLPMRRGWGGYNRGMSKILLAVSDRWIPDSRVDAIGDFAQRLARPILAMHVAYGSEQGGSGVPSGERVLEQVAAQLRTRQPKVETLLMFSDDLGQAILKTAEEHKATMIVLGLSSKGVLTRLIEGNVSQTIIKGARMPVLLLPADWI